MAIAQDNIWCVNKPLDWTSFDVVNKIKYALKGKGVKTKVGHAGTLDPKATGLLILCTGTNTKCIEAIQNMPKWYRGTFYLGATTPCYDTEQPIDATFDIEHVQDKLIIDTAHSFLGEQLQIPPIHSAVKVDGKNAYEYARKGKPIALNPKTIHIYDFQIEKIEMPEVYVNIQCSKGTYIRSLAHDFGKRMDAGAYLSSLQRTRIGDYKLEDAFEVEDLCTYIQKQ